MCDSEDDDEEFLKHQLETYNDNLQAAMKREQGDKDVTYWRNEIKAISEKIKKYEAREVSENTTPIKVEESLYESTENKETSAPTALNPVNYEYDLRATFLELRKLLDQNLETRLDAAILHLENEKSRDLRTKPFLSADALKVLVDEIKLDFTASDLNTMIVRKAFDSIYSALREVAKLHVESIGELKLAVESISETYGNLNKSTKNLLREIESPLTVLSEFFMDNVEAAAGEFRIQFEQLKEVLSSQPPSESNQVKQLMDMLKAMLNKWDSCCSGRETSRTELVKHFMTLLQEVRVMDFEKLIKLLQANDQNSDCLVGEKAVILLGSTGAGKSTLIHFLGGSKWEKIELEYAMHSHFKPIFSDTNLKTFTTSAHGMSETATVNCLRITNNNNTWIVDTPGFGDTAGAVQQLANIVGIVRALKKCKCVKPVFCVSDYDMGNRIAQSGFQELCQSMMELFALKSEEYQQLSYVISKRENPSKAPISETLKKESNRLLGSSAIGCKQLWDDFARKLERSDNVGAYIVSLFEESNRTLLINGLTNFDALTVNDPLNTFDDFIPCECKDTLSKQFSFHIKAIQDSVKSQNQYFLQQKLGQLKDLKDLLPTKECIDTYLNGLQKLYEELQQSLGVINGFVKAWIEDLKPCKDDDMNRFLYAFRQILQFDEVLQNHVVNLQVPNGVESISDLKHLTVRHFSREVLQMFVSTLKASEAFYVTKNLIHSESDFPAVDISSVQTWLKNIQLTFIALKSTQNGVNQYSRDIVKELDVCFKTNCNHLKSHFDMVNKQVYGWITELRLVDCLPQLQYIKEFEELLIHPFIWKNVTLPPIPPVHVKQEKGSVALKAVVDSSAISEIANHLYEAVRISVERYCKMSIDSLLKEQVDIHRLLSELHSIVRIGLQNESMKLHAAGLKLEYLQSIYSQLYSALTKSLEAIKQQVLSLSTNRDNQDTFMIAAALIADYSQLMQHAQLDKKATPVKEQMEKHVHQLAVSLHSACHDALIILWGDNSNLIEEFPVDSFEFALIQLYYSALKFRTSYFHELTVMLYKQFAKALKTGSEFQDHYVQSFSVNNTVSDILGQLRWKYRATTIGKILFKLSTLLDGNQELTGVEEFQRVCNICREFSEMLSHRVFDALKRCEEFHCEIIKQFDRSSGLCNFYEAFDDTFDYGRGHTKVIYTWWSKRMYLEDAERAALLQVMTNTFENTLQGHYLNVDSHLRRQYNWLLQDKLTAEADSDRATNTNYDIFSIHVQQSMFNELATGLKYLHSMDVSHAPPEELHIAAERFVQSSYCEWVARLAFKSYAISVTKSSQSIPHLTQLAKFSTQLSESFDDIFLGTDQLQFPSFSKRFKTALKGSIKGTKLAIIERNYERVAQGLDEVEEEDDDDDQNFSSYATSLETSVETRLSVREELMQSLQNELRNHIQTVESKLAAFDFLYAVLPQASRSLWKELVKLHHAEKYLHPFFPQLEMKHVWSRFLESIDEFAGKLAQCRKKIGASLKAKQITEVFVSINSLRVVLSDHKCGSFLFKEGGDSIKPCVRTLCRVCSFEQDNQVDLFQNTTELGTKVLELIKMLGETIALVGKKLEKELFSQIKQCKMLSCSTDEEEFKQLLPSPALLEQFCDALCDNDHHDEATDSNTLQLIQQNLKSLFDIVRQQINTMLDTVDSALSSGKVDDSSPVGVVSEAERVITMLHKYRYALPRLSLPASATSSDIGDETGGNKETSIDLSAEFKRRIEDLYLTMKDLIDQNEMKRTVAMNAKSRLENLFYQFRSGADKNKLNEELAKASSDLQAALGSKNFLSTVEQFTDEILIWEKQGMAKTFTQKIKQFLIHLQTFYEETFGPNKLAAVGAQRDTLFLLISEHLNLIDKTCCLIFSENHKQYIAIVPSFEEKVLNIIRGLVKTLSDMFDKANTDLEELIRIPAFARLNNNGKNIVGNTATTSVSSKRLSQLCKAAKFMRDNEHFVQFVLNLSTNFPQLLPHQRVFDAKDLDKMNQLVCGIYVDIHKFFSGREFSFDNQETRNTNKTDRETFYESVATYYVFLQNSKAWKLDLSAAYDSEDGWKPLTTEDIDKRISLNISFWVTIGTNSIAALSVENLNIAELHQFNLATSNLVTINETFKDLTAPFDTHAKEGMTKLDTIFCKLLDGIKHRCLTLATEGNELVVDITTALTLLHRIGQEVTTYSERIFKSIEHILKCHSDKKPTGLERGKFIGEVGIELNGSTDGTGQLIISEHSIFKGYEVYLRNTRFTQLTLDQMIDDIDGTDLDKEKLKEAAKSFTALYWGKVDHYRNSKNRNKIPEYPDKIRLLASQPKNDWESVLNIIAGVFAYWTLNNLKQSESSGSTDQKFLLQPHLGQILAVLRLLGFDSSHSPTPLAKRGWFPFDWLYDKSFQLQNHLVQVRTGEGKSVILGVLSIVLALMNFEVDCVCYSKHLSVRDYEEFEQLFKAFGVEDSIRYGTFNEHCEVLLNRNGNIREQVERTIASNHKTAAPVTTPTNLISKTRKLTLRSRKQPIHQQIRKKDTKQRILLIDEVDVFFQPGFYGSVYNVFTTIKGSEYPEIESLVRKIWNSYRQSSLSEERIMFEVKASAEYTACLNVFHPDWHPLVEEAIGYEDTDNTISYQKVRGYYTMFAYCKEFDRNRITDDVLKTKLNILIQSASFSYAEFPKRYDGILGVSGTLRTLSAQETAILNTEYGLSKFTYLPSAYGREPHLWDPNAPGSIHIIKKVTLFHTALVDEIRRRQGESSSSSTAAAAPTSSPASTATASADATTTPPPPPPPPPKKAAMVVQRPILVFFRKRKDIEMFRDSEAFALYRNEALVLYAGMKETERKENIKRSMEKGRITLLTCEFGRGTNFYCPSKEIEDRGGVHVISTFISIEISEEVQIKGRAGRQGCSGSFSMVLPPVEMELLHLEEKEVEEMESTGKRYDVINKTRLGEYEKQFPERLQYIQEILAEHLRSETFIEHLFSPRTDSVTHMKEYLLRKNESHFGVVHSRTIILLDATGSMGHVLQHAKTTVSSMIERVTEILKQVQQNASGYQLQFVAYRNYNSHVDQLLQCSSWESSAIRLVEFISTIEADGGWGVNEAMEVAFAHVNRMASTMKVTQVIVIGDAAPNTDAEVIQKRGMNNGLRGHPHFSHPVKFSEQLQSMVDQGIRINSFYIQGSGGGAVKAFQQMASSSGGKCEALNVHSPQAKDLLTGIVSTNILQDIGLQTGGAGLANQLVNAYRKKYAFQMDGFVG